MYFILCLRCICFFIFILGDAVADPQTLLEEKEAAEEKLAISDYELRLAQEDILKLKSELQKKAENLNEVNGIFLVSRYFNLAIFHVFCVIDFPFNVTHFLHLYV